VLAISRTYDYTLAAPSAPNQTDARIGHAATSHPSGTGTLSVRQRRCEWADWIQLATAAFDAIAAGAARKAVEAEHHAAEMAGVPRPIWTDMNSDAE
jgi:hypothetical protein